MHPAELPSGASHRGHLPGPRLTPCGYQAACPPLAAAGEAIRRRGWLWARLSEGRGELTGGSARPLALPARTALCPRPAAPREHRKVALQCGRCGVPERSLPERRDRPRGGVPG